MYNKHPEGVDNVDNWGLLTVPKITKIGNMLYKSALWGNHEVHRKHEYSA